MGFDPSQPREPKGSPTGGQWVSFTHPSLAELRAKGTVSEKNMSGLRYDKEKKRWVNVDGEPVPPEIEARLKLIGARPGTVMTSLNPDFTAPMAGRYIDQAGRKQRLYLASQSERSAPEKFARLKEFDARMEKIEGAIRSDLRAGKDEAAVLTLINSTGIRVGSDAETFAKVKSYGASTLEGRHIKLDGDTIKLSFVGKSGKLFEGSVNNPELAAFLRKKDLRDNAKVFDTNSRKVLAATKKYTGGDFKTKDFRTWHGTSEALRLIAAAPKPRNESEWKELHKTVAAGVAKYLNNTPKVAVEHYIDPAVWPDKNGF